MGFWSGPVVRCFDGLKHEMIYTTRYILCIEFYFLKGLTEKSMLMLDMVPRAVFEVAQQKLLEKEEEVEVRKLFDICSWDGVSLNQRVGGVNKGIQPK